jgi:hypothetical protein
MNHTDGGSMMDHTGGWMGGWLDGRRDVALDGDRRTGGGPAGCPDHEGVQEIIVGSRPASEVNCQA